MERSSHHESDGTILSTMPLTARKAVGVRGWLAVLPLTVCLACSDGGGNGGSSGGGDVSGAWCGMQVATATECVGDEVVYAEFAQSGTTVIGQSCERATRAPSAFATSR
jgi:hypothetical protein